MTKTIADRLAEAFAEWVHARRGASGTRRTRQLAGGARRRGPRRHPARIRYPACPDHSVMRKFFDLLGAEAPGFALTETYATLPPRASAALYRTVRRGESRSAGSAATSSRTTRAEDIAPEDAERWLRPRRWPTSADEIALWSRCSPPERGVLLTCGDTCDGGGFSDADQAAENGRPRLGGDGDGHIVLPPSALTPVAPCTALGRLLGAWVAARKSTASWPRIVKSARGRHRRRGFQFLPLGAESVARCPEPLPAEGRLSARAARRRRRRSRSRS